MQNKLGLFAAILFIFQVVPYGLAVRIPGFHPGGPGSTPGMGISNFFPKSDSLFRELTKDGVLKRKLKFFKVFIEFCCQL